MSALVRLVADRPGSSNAVVRKQVQAIVGLQGDS